jgi:hypothetical protein
MADELLATSILSKAGQDVRLLLAHVAREGKALEPNESAAILDAAGKIAAGTITSAEEGAFWKLYAELVKLAHPARIDSLYFGDYVTSVGGPAFEGSPIVIGIRKHEATIRKVRRLSVMSFAITLILLAYLSITESLLKRNEELGREYQVLIAGAWQGTEIEAAVNLVLRRALTSGRRPARMASRPLAKRRTLSARRSADANRRTRPLGSPPIPFLPRNRRSPLQKRKTIGSTRWA